VGQGWGFMSHGRLCGYPSQADCLGSCCLQDMPFGLSDSASGLCQTQFLSGNGLQGRVLR